MTAGVAVGHWASIYIDGASVAVYTVRITAVQNLANGTITTSATAFAGTAPITSATTRTIKVGGAWSGPGGASAFPLTLGSFAAAQDAAGDMCRINFKNDQTYSISATITSSSSQFVMQGYGSSPGDGGRAIIDGTTNVIKLLSVTGGAVMVADFIFVSSATSGTTDLCSDSNSALWLRCVFHGGRANGLVLGNSASTAIECEAYDNNKSNTAAKGGFVLSLAGAACYRCVSHDNTGSNTAGFVLSTGAGIVDHCIADTNGGKGINIPSGSTATRALISACDIYNNGSDGIAIATTSNTMGFFIENSNLIKNTGAGINVTSTLGFYYGSVFNVGYGSGTQANGSADTLGALEQSGTVTYASGVTPWVDPANGDFRINLGAAIAAGRGVFTETSAGYSAPNTVGYPDIGAAQHKDIAGGIWRNGEIWLPDGFVGRHYNHKWDSPTDFIMSISSGSLPAGLSLTQLDSSSWQIDGTPTTAGAYTFDILFGGSGGFTDTFHITINTAIGQVSYGFNG